MKANAVRTCAARSAARAGLETGVPSRTRREAGWGYDVRWALPSACRSEDRRSRPARRSNSLKTGGPCRCPLRPGARHIQQRVDLGGVVEERRGHAELRVSRRGSSA